MFTGVGNNSTLSKCQTRIQLKNTEVPGKTVSHFWSQQQQQINAPQVSPMARIPKPASPIKSVLSGFSPHCTDRTIKFSTPFYSSLYATSFLPSLLFKLLFLPSSLPPLPAMPVTHQLSVCLPSARFSNTPGTSPWPIRRLRRLLGCSTCFSCCHSIHFHRLISQSFPSFSSAQPRLISLL